MSRGPSLRWRQRWKRASAAAARIPTRTLVAQLLRDRLRDSSAQLVSLYGRTWLSTTTGPAIRALLDLRRRRRASVAADILRSGLLTGSRTPAQNRALARALLPVLGAWQIEPYALGMVVEGLQGLLPELDQRTRLARDLLQAVGRVLLEHPSPDVRADAVYALGHCRTREAARLLRRAESDRSEFWRGRVGAYAKYYGRVCRGDEPTTFFRDVRRSRAWYAARSASDRALVAAARRGAGAPRV